MTIQQLLSEITDEYHDMTEIEQATLMGVLMNRLAGQTMRLANGLCLLRQLARLRDQPDGTVDGLLHDVEREIRIQVGQVEAEAGYIDPDDAEAMEVLLNGSVPADAMSLAEAMEIVDQMAAEDEGSAPPAVAS